MKAKLGGECENLLLDTGMSDGLWVFKEDTVSTNFMAIMKII